MIIDKFNLAPPSYVIAIIFVTIVLGLYVFVLMVEHVVAKNFIEFKSSQLFWVLLIAFAAYVAKGYASEELNQIFARSASTFPFAYSAAAAMKILSIMKWPTAFIFILSFSYGLIQVFRSKGAHAFIALVMSINFSSFGLFVEKQISPDEVRRSNIYQIAVAMDFNGRFNCPGVKEKVGRIAFIDSDQTKGIVAPPLVIKIRHEKSTFKLVEVPEYFVDVACL